jgi:tetratricopeptide (TPR) repeat protein
MNPVRFLSCILFLFVCLASAGLLIAQDNQEDQPHIQPRKEEKEKRPARPSATPNPDSPTTPTPANSGNSKSESPDDIANRPNDPPPGMPDAEPAGESSSKDSQIDLNAGPDTRSPISVAPSEYPFDPHRAQKDVEVGNYYLKQRNYRAALERFHDALLYKPKDAEATFGLAVTQEKLELLLESYRNYKGYLALLPEGPMAKDAQEGLARLEPRIGNNNLGTSAATQAAAKSEEGQKLLAANDYAAARLDFEQALRLDPDNADTHFHLAQSLQGLQQLDPARMHYQKYLELKPKGPLAADARKNLNQIRDILGK